MNKNERTQLSEVKTLDTNPHTIISSNGMGD